MKFQNTVTLLGVVGKKGAGKLDSGQEWSTDRVELHVLSDFDASDSMSKGQTVATHRVEDYAKNFQKAIACVGQRVVIDFEMIPSKKLGAPPKIVATSFAPERVAKVS